MILPIIMACLGKSNFEAIENYHNNMKKTWADYRLDSSFSRPIVISISQRIIVFAAPPPPAVFILKNKH